MPLDPSLSHPAPLPPEGRWSDPTSQTGSSPLERLLFATSLECLGLLERTGVLRSILRWPVARFLEGGALGPPCPERLEYCIDRVEDFVRAETAERPRESWSTIATRMQKRVAPNGRATVISARHFEEELAGVIEARFTAGNKVKLLIDGPCAFDKRYRLAQKAQYRIFVMSLHFDNDATGRRMSRFLADAARRGVDVRVLVDEKYSSQCSNAKTLDAMARAGVKVVRWCIADAPLLSLHGKIFLADDQAILGGMNYGDWYSHRWQLDEAGDNTADNTWRDTDILVKGEATLQAMLGFAERWNEAISDDAWRMEPGDLQYFRLLHNQPQIAIESPKPILPWGLSTKVKGARVAIVGDRPDRQSRITEGLLKLIWGAEHTIDIENAYFVELPPIQHALREAVKRGVRVRILTNSETTTCEPILAEPTLRTVKDLVNAGAEGYLTKEKYNHSKVAVFDNQYVVLGSHNLHPRTTIYDCEVQAFVHNSAFAKEATRMFEHDIDESIAKPIDDDYHLPKSSLGSRFLLSQFYWHT